jgi:hypothetical protein
MFGPASLLSISSKEARILSLLMERHPNKKMVVFTSFLVEVEHLMLLLKMFGIGAVKLAGGMNPQEKRAAEKALQSDPRTRVIVCTLATAAHCYTFTAARVLVMMDPWWAKYMDDQARKRIHRVSQTKTTVVYAFRSRIPKMMVEAFSRASGRNKVSSLTIDDRIYEIQHKKELEAKRLLGNGLDRLNVSASSGAIYQKQASELMKSITANMRPLCTMECHGVLTSLGVNPIVAAMVTSCMRGSAGSR